MAAKGKAFASLAVVFHTPMMAVEVRKLVEALRYE
jgi:hypothetical protein